MAGKLPKRADHNKPLHPKPRIYARHNDMFRDNITRPFVFTKTDLRNRVKQLNAPALVEANWGERFTVAEARRELLKEANW